MNNWVLKNFYKDKVIFKEGSTIILKKSPYVRYIKCLIDVLVDDIVIVIEEEKDWKAPKKFKPYINDGLSRTRILKYIPE